MIYKEKEFDKFQIVIDLVEKISPLKFAQDFEGDGYLKYKGWWNTSIGRFSWLTDWYSKNYGENCDYIADVNNPKDKKVIIDYVHLFEDIYYREFKEKIQVLVREETVPRRLNFD